MQFTAKATSNQPISISGLDLSTSSLSPHIKSMDTDNVVGWTDTDNGVL